MRRKSILRAAQPLSLSHSNKKAIYRKIPGKGRKRERERERERERKREREIERERERERE